MLRLSSPRWCALAALVPALAVPATPDLTSALFVRLQAARLEGGLSELKRRADLDAVALERARRIAALPHGRRLALRQSLADSLRVARIEHFARATEHVGLERGHPDPGAAFLATWHSYGGAWEMVTDAGYDAVGLASTVCDDGWFVLVAIFVEEPPAPPDPRVLEQETLRAINQVRLEHGLLALVENPLLSGVARSHSEDMARRHYFDHHSPEGADLVDRIRPTGISYGKLAENIQSSRGVADPASRAVESWLDSKHHRENILAPEFRETGVGVALSDEGVVLFTQMFLAPRSPSARR